ncbi:hypothetical protein AiwAL_08540 [Acidiphilium sp. AL]|uniref:Uncharacterized protein n=1 Tax=Acidiphilium iwatense TaxID=768198 RepID=A0ABS9DQY8_9PROT|nr:MULTISPECIES: hypothetical protein [Acidiphilium]MCF3945171.1 hypothetical protein [Acidiphilium iwatense]MCU4160156.1 hypothetical protein [Acidiphilium sp. AL]
MSTGFEPELPTRWLAPLSADTRRHLARLLIGEAADAPEPEPAPALRPEPAPAIDPAAALAAATAGKIGLVSVSWPDLAHPLWLRAGSNDAADCAATMRDFAAQLRIPFAPKRIIELGAGAGYRSVALAQAHPDATIASLEAVPALARLHALNTLPWRQIAGARLAVSETARHYAVASHADTGRPALAAMENGPIQAVTLAELYRRLGWDGADVLIADPDFCSGLDSAAIAPALAGIRLIAIARPGPDVALPAGLLANLPEATHARRASRDYELFFRRESETPVAPPRRLAAFDIGGAATSCERIGITSDPWSFFPISDTGFRLHPNPADALPPRLILRQFLAGPRRFESTLRLNHAEARPVRFRVAIFAGETDRAIHRDETVLSASETRQWSADLPLYFGEARIAFSTEMADPADANGFAWAEFIDPGFL